MEVLQIAMAYCLLLLEAFLVSWKIKVYKALHPEVRLSQPLSLIMISIIYAVIHHTSWRV